MKTYFKSEGQNYTLGNKYIERTWHYNGQSLFTTSLIDRLNNRVWIDIEAEQSMDFSYEGLTNSYTDKELKYTFELIDVQVNKINKSYCSDSGLEAVFILKDKMHGVDIRWHAVVYDDAPAVRTYIEVKSLNFPMGEFFERERVNVLDTYRVTVKDGTIRSYEFFTRTDTTNELVKENANPSCYDKGNLMFYIAPDDMGLFILKESPCFKDQRPECAGNFRIENDAIQTMGWGIRPEEFSDTTFLRTYGSVIGVFKGGYYDAMTALKKYQFCRFAIDPVNELMIMANPWGD